MRMSLGYQIIFIVLWALAIFYPALLETSLIGVIGWGFYYVAVILENKE